MTTLFGDIPSAPLYHQPRPDALSGLVAKVLGEAGPVGVTGRAAGVGLEGMGGIGKTTLAADLCREPTVTAAFPGGIFWITLGETPDVAQAQQRLARWIGGAPVTLRDTAEGRDRLTTLLADHAARGLIVLDDLWELAHVRELLPASVGGHRLLFTTRRGDLLRTLGAEEHRVEEMTPSAARALLAACARRPEDRLPAPADAIIRECGRLPLALAIVGALLADQDAACWDEVLAALRRADHKDLDAELPDYTRSRHVFGALAVSVDRLEPEERDRFADLAVFPEDTAIPAAVFERLWPNETSLKRSRRLALFVDRNLARRTADGRVTLHDLQRDYLVGALAKDTLPKRHRRLVDGYRAACRGVWRDCPDDGYVFRWLPWHLRAAGETDELRGLLFNPAWMAAKLRTVGAAALEADYALLPDDAEARLVGGALRLSSHVLTKAPDQLASQLWGRLAPDQGARIAALLDAAGDEHGANPWLKPRRPTLTPPGGPLIRTLVGHSSWVTAVAALADDRRAISGSHDKTLKLWDIDTGACLATMVGHAGPVRAVAALTDGRRAISGSWDKTLKLWDLGTGACLATIVGHADCVNAVAVLAEGRRAISGGSDKTLKLWDLNSCACLATMEGHSNSVSAVAALADGRRAISGSSDKTLKLWDLNSGACLATMVGHSYSVDTVVVLADGRRALSGSFDRTLKLWDLDTGACLATMAGHSNWLRAVTVLADDRHALSGSDDNTLKLWNLDTGACLATMVGHLNIVNAVAAQADGRRALSGSNDDTLKLWDLNSSAHIATIARHADCVNAVAVLADGRRAISGGSDKTLKLWDLDTGACLATMEGHSYSIDTVAALADGRRALSGSGDKTIKLWDLDTGACLATMERYTGWVRAVAALADGRRALSGSFDHTLKLWDLDTGACLATMVGHAERVNAVAAVADGRRAFSGSYDKTLKLWDLDTGACLATMKGHTDSVRAVAALTDGRSTLSGSSDKTLKLWDLDTGACLATMEGHTRGVRAVAALADGRHAISGSDDKTIKLWDLDTGVGRTLFTAEAAITSCSVTGATVVAGDAVGNLHVFDLILPPETTP